MMNDNDGFPNEETSPLVQRIENLEKIVKEQKENLMKLMDNLPAMVQNIIIRNKPVNKHKNE